MQTKLPNQPLSYGVDLGRTSTAVPIDDVPEVVPVEEEPTADDRSILGLVDMILKAPGQADAIARDEARQAELLPRFLGIALSSYTVFALVLVLLLNLASPAGWPTWPLRVPPAHWNDGTFLAPVLAYTLGLVAASGLCLPSFYFIGLLAGVRLSWVQVIGIVARCKAASAVVLLGILPIYVAVILGLIVFRAQPEVLQVWLYPGLMLPFLAGLQGVVSIYHGVMGLADTLPTACRSERTCFLRRLTLGWSACYTAVAPVMIYRLWEFFASILA
jgi:hypothetical protein